MCISQLKVWSDQRFSVDIIRHEFYDRKAVAELRNSS